MSNSIAPGSSADVNVKVTALNINPNVPAQYKTIILKKNLVNGVNTLTQEMMSTTNTKYVIKYDYVLGEDITIPANCVLEFDGGSVTGSLVICNGTIVKGNYKDSIQYISGSFITEEYIKSIGLSELLSNYIIVKNGTELSAALSEGSPNYNTIFLMGDVFIISSKVTINFGGNVVPYPGYKPQVISGTETVYKYEQDPDNNDYLICNMPSMTSGRHFYLFDDNGNNIEVQKLSDIIKSTPVAVGDIIKNNSIIKILMDSKTAEVLANKTQEELKYCVLMLNAGFTTVQIDKLYTDSLYIYGEIWQYEYWTSYYNYERSTYGVNAPFEIYNVPIYGGGKAFIDGNKVLHMSKAHAGYTILGKSEKVFDFASSTKLTFNGITFKGGGANTFFDGGVNSNKVFIDCTFDHVLSCYTTSNSPVAENIVFDGCRFDNIGSSALNLRGRNIIVKNCSFNKIGLLKKRANCIEFLGYDGVIENNTFCDFSYSAVYTGNAEYNSCVINNNIIEQREYANDPKKHVLRDAGAIYVHIQNFSVLIENNIIRHIVCPPSSTTTYDNRGIFLDNGANNVSVKGNIIFDTSSFCIDARYVESLGEYSSLNNSITYNLIYGGLRAEGNPAATDEQKITVTENLIASDFNVVTNQYIKESSNVFTAMSVTNDTVKCKFNGIGNNFVANHIERENNIPFNTECNIVNFIVNQSATVRKNIYCPTIPNKQTTSGVGIYYATYKVSFCTDYSEYPGITYTLNVIFNTKNGRAAIIDIKGVETMATNRAYIKKITTQSIADAKVSNKGFLLSIVMTGDSIKNTYCMITLESIKSINLSLPCSTYLLVEDGEEDESVEVIKVPVTHGSTSTRPVFSTYLDSLYKGFRYFDESLSPARPIYYEGSNVWVDATGTQV